MITIRAAQDRGHANHGWLDSHHSFSFANYQDPRHMGFRALRVINEDRVQPGKGFGTHPHRDMEIISVVLEGALEHKDSLGTGSVIRPGDVQRMTAGTGILHSEFNHSPTDPVHFLQIWILPQERGLEPSYEQRAFPAEQRLNQLRLVASPDGRDGSLTVHQDARVYVSVLQAGAQIEHTLDAERHAWVQVVSGSLKFNDQILQAGDGASVSGESSLSFSGSERPEFLLFDLS